MQPQFLQMLGVKGSDMDIIEVWCIECSCRVLDHPYFCRQYFTEVIRTQQLSAKHIYNGTPQDDGVYMQPLTTLPPSLLPLHSSRPCSYVPLQQAVHRELQQTKETILNVISTILTFCVAN